MKLQYTYLILLFGSFLTQTEPVTKDVNVNFNLNVTTNQNQSNEQAAHAASQVEQKVINDIVQNNEQNQINIQETLQNMYNDQMQKCKDATASLLEYIYNNKIKCTCGVLATLYAYIAYQTYAQRQIIYNSSSWCNWRNDVSTEEFFAAPADKTGAELLREIQSRYADPQDPTNFIYSLVKFTKILQDEIEKLEKLKFLYAWIKTTQCSRLFFIDETMHATIQAKLHKALFIKHIFSTWYASYKIEKNC